MRTRVFIDGNMLHKIGMAAAYDIDWLRFRGLYLPEAAETVAFEFFNIEMVKADGTSTLRRLIDWLELNGYRTRIIEVDSDEKNSLRDARPELMVWMAVEIVNAAHRGADNLVVWASDRALSRALISAQAAGASITVIAELENCPTAIRRIADSFVDIKTLRADIESTKERASA